MDVDHGVAAIEKVKQRIERGVAEEFLAIAREQRNTLEAQRFEAIARFGDGRVDVVHRHQTEAAEALRMLGDQLGCVIVAAAGEGRGLVRRQESDARLPQRQHRKRNPMLVHELERQLGRPIRIAADRRPGAGLVHRLAIELRNEVEVHVDHARCHGARSSFDFPSPLWGGAGVGVGRLLASGDACAPPRDPHPIPPHKGEGAACGSRSLYFDALMVGTLVQSSSTSTMAA